MKKRIFFRPSQLFWTNQVFVQRNQDLLFVRTKQDFSPGIKVCSNEFYLFGHKYLFIQMYYITICSEKVSISSNAVKVKRNKDFLFYGNVIIQLMSTIFKSFKAFGQRIFIIIWYCTLILVRKQVVYRKAADLNSLEWFI